MLWDTLYIIYYNVIENILIEIDGSYLEQSLICEFIEGHLKYRFSTDIIIIIPTLVYAQCMYTHRIIYYRVVSRKSVY